MMMDCIIRRKRLLTIILLTVFVALGARAQDDEDIAHSLNLTEVVVLADGMTFEEYLLKQVLAHAKPLKDRTQSLKYTVTCQVEKDMDLTKFPHRRTITFAARLAGYGPIVSALREHKHFGITVAEDVVFQNGKMTNSKARMVEMKQKLTDKQIASFLKPDLFLLSHGKAKLYIDKEKWPQGFVSLKLDYDYK